MSRYDCNAMAPLVGKKYFLLLSGDYGKCEGRNWISSDVMDSYMMIGHNTTWQNTQFIPSAHTGFMLGDMSDKRPGPEWHMYNLQWDFEGLVFLPYARTGHWCLLVLDIEKGSITHYDPMQHGNTARGVEAMNKFQQYLTDCNTMHLLCRFIWEITYETERRSIQTDRYNCGIYVMYFMDCFASIRTLIVYSFRIYC